MSFMNDVGDFFLSAADKAVDYERARQHADASGMGQYTTNNAVERPTQQLTPTQMPASQAATGLTQTQMLIGGGVLVLALFLALR